MPITIRMQRELSDEFCSDVLICAFDGSYGGSWYWAEPDRRVEVDGVPQSPWQILRSGRKDRTGEEIGEDQWLAVHIRGKEGEETGKAVWDLALENGINVDYQTLRVGIQRILDGEAKYHSSTLFEAIAEADAGMIDATDADAIVQAGVFGEVVYG